MSFFFQTIVVSSLIKQEPLIYDASWGRYHYPELGYAVGWSLSAASIILIPGYAIYHIFFKQKGTIKTVCINSKSQAEKIFFTLIPLIRFLAFSLKHITNLGTK